MCVCVSGELDSCWTGMAMTGNYRLFIDIKYAKLKNSRNRLQCASTETQNSKFKKNAVHEPALLFSCLSANCCFQEHDCDCESGQRYQCYGCNSVLLLSMLWSVTMQRQTNATSVTMQQCDTAEGCKFSWSDDSHKIKSR